MITEIKSSIKTGMEKLEAKQREGTLRNTDFTEAWTHVVLLPLYRIEHIIRTSENNRYDNDQAVLYGMLMRIYKYIEYMRRFVCKRLMTEELGYVFGRIILEDNIALQYYIKHSDPASLEKFRKSSVRPEKEFEDKIIENRQNRTQEENDEIKDWEDALLASIRRAYELAGTSSSDVHENKIPQRPAVAEMAKEVGLEDLYISYRVQCHAMHGDWFNITHSFLKKDGDVFFPNFDDTEADIRLLNPILFVCYTTLSRFLSWERDQNVDDELKQELQAELDIIHEFDEMHHHFLREEARRKKGN